MVYLGFVYLGSVICCCIKQIVSDTEDVSDFVSESNIKLIDECIICLEEYGDNPIRTLKCSHSFHKKCIDKWILQKNECPICSYSPLNDFNQ